MRIGIHVRGFAAGKPVAVARALERGAETIQIFASNPRSWRLTAVNPETDREFVRQMKRRDVKPLFIHVPYLVNLAASSPRFRRLSMRTLAWTLQRADSLHAAGVVVHAGSASTQRRTAVLRRIGRTISVLLPEDRGPKLILELTAGGFGAVATRFDEVAELLDACDGHRRIAICVDTCHLQAAGYEMSTTQGVHQMVAELVTHAGMRRLALIHTNDSRDPQGSRRDRHAAIGRGTIGREGFRALVQHPNLQRIPMICETPGELREDRLNIARLKSMRLAN
jgi:deoxyribonuclease-4